MVFAPGVRNGGLAGSSFVGNFLAIRRVCSGTERGLLGERSRFSSGIRNFVKPTIVSRIVVRRAYECLEELGEIEASSCKLQGEQERELAYCETGRQE